MRPRFNSAAEFAPRCGRPLLWAFAHAATKANHLAAILGGGWSLGQASDDDLPSPLLSSTLPSLPILRSCEDQACFVCCPLSVLLVKYVKILFRLPVLTLELVHRLVMVVDVRRKKLI